VYAQSNSFGATIAGNRILAGSASGGSAQLVGGISLVQTAAPWIVNNAIQAGASASGGAYGLTIVQGAGAVVQENTIFGSTQPISLQGATGVFVQNNLLLGDATTSTAAVALEGCNKTFGATTLAAFTNNAIVNVGSNLVTRNDLVSSSCTTTKLGTIAAIQTSLASSTTTATGNTRVSSDCSGDSSTACVVEAACTLTQSSETACISTVLGTWDDPTQGVIDLTDSTRSWALGSSAPCTIAQGGGLVLSDPLAADGGSYDDTVDLTGQTRTSPVSIGAYENDVQCAH
jgi:hypothetical protein